MLNVPPFFDAAATLVRPAGYVVSAASQGPRTPSYTPLPVLARGFERRGLRTVSAGTYYVAERPNERVHQCLSLRGVGWRHR